MNRKLFWCSKVHPWQARPIQSQSCCDKCHPSVIQFWPFSTFSYVCLSAISHSTMGSSRKLSQYMSYCPSTYIYIPLEMKIFCFQKIFKSEVRSWKVESFGHREIDKSFMLTFCCTLILLLLFNKVTLYFCG